MDADAAGALGATLAARYAAIHAGPMRDMPVCNEALTVAPVGFRPFGDGAAGIVITPWFMNLVIVGALARDVAAGARRLVALPAGDVDFVAGMLDGFGPLLCCSIFSPMFDFPDMATADATAQEAMAALFDPALLDNAAPATARRLDRRALLLGHREARP
jgi:[NiFe] hydrogenase assembly HybE family chaperone